MVLIYDLEDGSMHRSHREQIEFCDPESRHPTAMEKAPQHCETPTPGRLEAEKSMGPNAADYREIQLSPSKREGTDAVEAVEVDPVDDRAEAEAAGHGSGDVRNAEEPSSDRDLASEE